MEPPPVAVADKAAWRDLELADTKGVDLTEWEVGFVESLRKQLLTGRHLSEKQRFRLDAIIEDRVEE